MDRKCLGRRPLVPKARMAIAEVVTRGLDARGKTAGVGLVQSRSARAPLAESDRRGEIIMHDRRVIGVGAVLMHDLPVARRGVDAVAADNFKWLRGRGDKDIDHAMAAPRCSRRSGTCGVRAAEDEAAIAVDPRDRPQIETRNLERFRPTGLTLRHRNAPSLRIEAEAVIGTGEAAAHCRTRRLTSIDPRCPQALR